MLSEETLAGRVLSAAGDCHCLKDRTIEGAGDSPQSEQAPGGDSEVATGYGVSGSTGSDSANQYMFYMLPQVVFLLALMLLVWWITASTRLLKTACEENRRKRASFLDSTFRDCLPIVPAVVSMLLAVGVALGVLFALVSFLPGVLFGRALNLQLVVGAEFFVLWSVFFVIHAAGLKLPGGTEPLSGP